MSGVASSPTDRPVFVLRRRVCLAPPPGLLHGPARSGDAIGGLQPLRCPLPYGTPASRAGGSGGRTGGHRDPSAGRAFSPGVCRSGERSVPAEAAPPPVARLFFGAPGLIQGQSRSQSGPRLSRHSIHTGRRSPGERTAPTLETVHRASPSRNGSPAHHHWWRGWHACRCTLSPAGRAQSRKPIKPPQAARLIHDRGIQPGGAPEFRTE
jgi:hypothetical protein